MTRARLRRARITPSCTLKRRAVPKTSAATKARRAKKRAEDEKLAKLRDQVFERDGFCCRVCGRGSGFTATHGKPIVWHDIHAHHIKFRSQGGKHTTANLATVCLLCHDAIHARRVRVSGNADEALDIRWVA